MQQITLANTALKSAPIGFGCVRLTRCDDRRAALLLLEQAFESGITHYDVAPIYGFGEAERILGEFLKGKRDRVTVATKFGILPNATFAKHRRLVNFARWVSHRVGFVAALVARRHSSSHSNRPAFEPKDVLAGLEKSLRELAVDYIDLFLLHEYSISDANREDLLAWLDTEVGKGRIRLHGMGTEYSRLLGDAALVSRQHRVLQFDSNVLSPHVTELKHASDRGLITFGTLQCANQLVEAASRQPRIRRQFELKIGLDLTDASVIGDLLINEAVAANPHGILLFSTTRRDRVQANAASVAANKYLIEQLAEFRSFAAAVSKSVETT